MDIANLLLLLLLAIGVIGQNSSVSIAVAVLLLIRLLHLDKLFPPLEQYGLQVGIIILTIGVLTPIATGRIGGEEIARTFVSPISLLSIPIGIFVAYLGARGATLMAANPLVVTGLMIGTIIGVALFKGVPVGPLIAAGITSLILGIFNR
ncbi:MAG: DUF441 domain-containing protein [Tumebacillaceae bacterium]